MTPVHRTMQEGLSMVSFIYIEKETEGERYAYNYASPSLSRNKHKYFFMGTHTCRHTCTHTHTSIEREPSVVHLQALCGSLLPVPVQELRHNYVQDAHTHTVHTDKSENSVA